MLYFWISFLCLSPVWAHQSMLSGNDSDVKWTRTQVPLVVNVSSDNHIIQNIIQESIFEWNKFSDVKIVPNSNSQSSNSITFKKNFPYGYGVLGVTEVVHDDSGVIESAKILINNDHSYSSFSGSEKFLGDVVTHELGHFLGMGHSEVLDSSMFYRSFINQSSLAQDDIAGIRGKYKDYSFGKISGIIKGGNHIGVLGAHIQAISRNTGNSIGAISKGDGRFIITGLDKNDTYYLYTSPLKLPANSPEYFSNSQKMFCPAAYEGSFFSECGEDNKGKPAGIVLTDINPEMDVGVVTINCGYKTHLSYSTMKNSQSGVKEAIDWNHQSIAGWFHHPRISEVSESAPDEFIINLPEIFDGFVWKPDLYLRVSLVVHAFGAELDTDLNVLPHNIPDIPIPRLAVPGVTVPKTKNRIAQFKLISASDLVHRVSVSSYKDRNISYADIYPVLSSNKEGFSFPYLITIGLYEEQVDGKFIPYLNTEVRLSDNIACLEGPFTKAIGPTRTQIDKISTSDAQLAPPSCGTIDPPNNSGPGSGLMLISLGFLLSLLASIGVKSSKKFLS